MGYSGSRMHRQDAQVQAGRYGQEEFLIGWACAVPLSETSREERVSRLRGVGGAGAERTCPSRVAVGVARGSLGGGRPQGPRFRFRFASALAARASGHGVLHAAEGGPGLGGRPGRVAAAAQGLPVPRKATGAGAGARR